jgi:lysophospholipase L1-like esterase
MVKWQLLGLAVLLAIISCKKAIITTTEPVKPIDSTLAFNKVVILGNSITYTPQNPAIGWDANWGMAATKPDSDYVHILIRHFQVKNPKVTVMVKNIISFEADAEHYDFNAELKALRDQRPDLVIIRIGENVSPDVDLNMFDKRYVALMEYFKSSNPGVITLGGSSVWGSVADSLMSKHPPFVSLKSIVSDGSNFSYGLFDNIFIQGHPGNKGMRNIAALVWDKVKTLKSTARNKR